MNKTEKVALYVRASTDEAKQDITYQLEALRKFCNAYSWQWDEVVEYDSAFRGSQPLLQELIEKIRKKEYTILMTYSLDRFSRLTPTKTVSILHRIVEDFGCRFLTVHEGIDSSKEMWSLVMMIFSHMSHSFSRLLSQRVRDGIAAKKRRGQYTGGRPKRTVDIDRIREIIRAEGKLPLRKLAMRYNSEVPPKMRLSYTTLRKVLPLVQ